MLDFFPPMIPHLRGAQQLGKAALGEAPAQLHVLVGQHEPAEQHEDDHRHGGQGQSRGTVWGGVRAFSVALSPSSPFDAGRQGAIEQHREQKMYTISVQYNF